MARRLADLGAELHAVDPLISAREVPSYIKMVASDVQQVADADLVIVLTDHDEIDWALLEKYGDRVLDTRNRLSGPEVDRL